MSKNVWLYFGTSSRTLMIPASRLRGMHPDGDGTLELTFDSIVNTINTPADKASLNLFEDNTHLDVMKAITRAMHNETPTFNGFITIADDTTQLGFHEPEYLTDRDGTEVGTVVSINSLTIQDPTVGVLTATTAASYAAGTLTPRAGFWYILSDNASKVVHLPACYLGARVEYITNVSFSGCILACEVGTDKINNVDGEVGATIPSYATRVIAIGVSNTDWLVSLYNELGYLDSVGNGFDAPDLTNLNNEDIDIVSTGGSINLTATEDAADAIVLNASAGGIDISAVGAAGQDIDITNTGGSVNITATEDIAAAIVLNASAGGVAIGAVGEAGQDVDIANIGGSINIQATESATDAITINATTGGINIFSSGAAAGEDIDIKATGSSINLTSTEAISNAIVLSASNADGGIDITANKDIDITGSPVTISNRKDELATLSTITDSSITVVYGLEYIVNDSNGGAMVLPAAATGKRITIIIGTDLAGNLTITTAAVNQLFTGYAIMEATDAANNKTLFQPDGSNDDKITLNGSTTSGLVGDKIELTGISNTEWRVRATLSHTGSAATPFS